MRRVRDPSTCLLGADLLSKIGTDPIKLTNHCLDLVCSHPALTDFKFSNPAQMFRLVNSHGRSPQHVSLRGTFATLTTSGARFGPTNARSLSFLVRKREPGLLPKSSDDHLRGQRDHLRELHRWWEGADFKPLKVAQWLWRQSRFGAENCAGHDRTRLSERLRYACPE